MTETLFNILYIPRVIINNNKREFLGIFKDKNSAENELISEMIKFHYKIYCTHKDQIGKCFYSFDKFKTCLESQKNDHRDIFPFQFEFGIYEITNYKIHKSILENNKAFIYINGLLQKDGNLFNLKSILILSPEKKVIEKLEESIKEKLFNENLFKLKNRYNCNENKFKENVYLFLNMFSYFEETEVYL